MKFGGRLSYLSHNLAHQLFLFLEKFWKKGIKLTLFSSKIYPKCQEQNHSNDVEVSLSNKFENNFSNSLLVNSYIVFLGEIGILE